MSTDGTWSYHHYFTTEIFCNFIMYSLKASVFYKTCRSITYVEVEQKCLNKSVPVLQNRIQTLCCHKWLLIQENSMYDTSTPIRCCSFKNDSVALACLRWHQVVFLIICVLPFQLLFLCHRELCCSLWSAWCSSEIGWASVLSRLRISGSNSQRLEARNAWVACVGSSGPWSSI